jgi:tetratricopeptide (TPR) repeat protein
MTGAIAVAASVVVTGTVQVLSTRRAAQCRSASSIITQSWNADRKQRMRDRFVATQVPYAQFAFDHATAFLDAFVASWTHMRTDACEATYDRGEQSAELLDLRMACLTDSLQRFSATTHVLVDADRGVVDHAHAIASSLPNLSPCADVVSLRREHPTSLAPAQRDAMARVAGAVSAAEVFVLAGKYEEGMSVIEPAVTEAKSLGPSALAPALLVESDLEDFHGDDAQAERTAVEAARAAERADDLRRLVKARLNVGWSMRQQRHSADALRWTDLAETALERLGSDDFLSSRVAVNRAVTYDDLGQYDQARAQAETTLRLIQRAMSPESREIGAAYNNLGMVTHDQGRLDEALDF